ncbi:MAG: dethiobiotin synthase [Beijerinckiaceae bacterium]|nr:dethiobiotin synthase [Beijerinckiaceae bacterium]
MPGLFVTATGTEVGKTFVTAGLIQACRRMARLTGAMKPVVSGFDAREPGGSDPAMLLEALGLPVEPATIAMMSPWRFKAPLSPDMAAVLEGRTLDAAEVAAACQAVLEPNRLVLIEGVGGVMVPLNPGQTILDVMTILALPVVLVSPTGLGAISHLLTALEVLKMRGVSPAAVVLNESPGSHVPFDATAETISGFYPRGNLFGLRRGPTAPSPDATFDALLAHLDRTALCHRD